MGNRLVRIVLSLIVGSVAVAIGLYFGRFVAAVAALPFASSRQALPFATGITWWMFIGLLAGVGLALTAVSRKRVRLFLASVVGFGLGGALAALVARAAGATRNSARVAIAMPVGGALAGLLLGLGMGLRARSVVVLIAGAVALWIATPHIGSVIPPSDWIALLAPGAILGAVLAALAPSERAVPPSA